MADLLPGLALGYAKAASGRVYHAVELEEVPRKNLADPGSFRVARALCGYVPVRWYAPATTSPDLSYVHKKCRALLRERVQQAVQS